MCVCVSLQSLQSGCLSLRVSSAWSAQTCSSNAPPAGLLSPLWPGGWTATLCRVGPSSLSYLWLCLLVSALHTSNWDLPELLNTFLGHFDELRSDSCSCLVVTLQQCPCWGLRKAPAREGDGRWTQHIYTPRGARGVESPAGLILNMTFCKLKWVFNKRLEATSQSCYIMCNVRRSS